MGKSNEADLAITNSFVRLLTELINLSSI